MTQATPVDITKKTLRVAEIFGPTIQGEGATVGMNAAFIRLSGCNLECTWCDTPYTWDWTGKNGYAYDKEKEATKMTIEEIVAMVEPLPTDRVIITGGEPLTQESGLVALLKALEAKGFFTEVETNGTRPFPEGAPATTRWNISPKLGNSGNVKAKRWKPKALGTYPVGMTAFKFVVGNRDDVDEVLGLMRELPVPLSMVYLMPEGKTYPEVYKLSKVIAELAIELGLNFSPRLHVMLWDDERGH